MSDEESFLEDDVSGGQDAEVGQKVGFLPAIVLKILKWAAIAVAAVIFIVTVVVVTMKVMNAGSRSGSVPLVSEQYSAKTPIYSTYSNFTEIRTRTADTAPYTVIADVVLEYQLNNKNIQNELVARTQQIQDLIRSYFAQRTAAELAPKNDAVIKQDLKERINAIMQSGKIAGVLFTQYNVLPM